MAPEQPVMAALDVSVMGDLQAFMMIEDLKINEDEMKFDQQTRLNVEKKKLREEMKNTIPRNIGSFEDCAYADDQDELAKDLGVNFSDNGDLSSEVQSTPRDALHSLNNPGTFNSQQTYQALMLQNQIKNIDSIFEPEPENTTMVNERVNTIESKVI